MEPTGSTSHHEDGFRSDRGSAHRPQTGKPVCRENHSRGAVFGTRNTRRNRHIHREKTWPSPRCFHNPGSNRFSLTSVKYEERDGNHHSIEHLTRTLRKLADVRDVSH